MSTRKLCVGTGLLALDIILNGNPKTLPKLSTGGSCGNVLTVLSYLGWESYPIARLKKNQAATEIELDLKHWNVKTELITKTDDGSTPVIIHRILKDKSGKPKHRFEFRDPESGKWLPAYKPVLSKDVPSILEKKTINATCFYFDRINRASIEFAKSYKEKGALVFFEPSSVGASISLFNECLAISDIIKFSNERIKNYRELFPKQQVALEIETCGKDGLNFRLDTGKKNSKWEKVPAYSLDSVSDSAGAGDWCSAGIISSLISHGKGKLTQETVRHALSYGQALGSINCYFDGARGAMYALDADTLLKLADKTVKTKRTALPEEPISNKHEGKKVKLSQLF